MNTYDIKIGDEFGKWKVIDVCPNIRRNKAFLCRCSCPNQTGRCIPATYLKRGKSKSCGCANATHGMSQIKVYSAWKSLHARKRAGIPVSERWLSSFELFYKDMGDPPTSEHLLGRRNTKLPFNVDNCEWITKVEQCRRKQNNKVIEYQGETKALVAWCEQLNLDYAIVARRIRGGWSVDETFTTPTDRGFYGSRHGCKYITGERFEEVYKSITVYVVTPEREICMIRKIRKFALDNNIKEATIYAALTKRAKEICGVKVASFLDDNWFICSINGRSTELSKKVKSVAELVAKALLCSLPEFSLSTSL